MKPQPDVLAGRHRERLWTDSLLAGAMVRGSGERHRCSQCGESLTMAEVIESFCITCAEFERKGMAR
jgi:hypothetical protein